MPVHNADIAAVFEEIADRLEIEGENRFRVRAYRNAARTLRGLGREVTAMLAAGEPLTDLPGIGVDLAGKIQDAVAYGPERVLAPFQEQTPRALIALLQIPGLGPKRVKALHVQLGIETPADLKRACVAGRVRALRGFGAKTEAHILKALAERAVETHRMPRATAAAYAEAYADYLRRVPGVEEVTIAGSYRRGQETVGDLDLLVSAPPDSPVMQRFVRYDEVATVAAQGPTRATVVLKSKLQVDLRVVPRESYGAALQYFTGGKAHNVALRHRAQTLGLKINEYGVFRAAHRIAGATEESVYQSVGLPYIPPELREDHGEIAAAEAGRLPRLIEPADLRGDLHAHTRATDGRNSLRQMALAARARDLEYLAITDHSQHLGMAHGLDAKRLRAQLEAIDRLNAELTGITLLKGIEVDILEDGRLDLSDDVLSGLDLIVGAVHSHFGLSRAQQTERILRAMDQRHFTLLAHPSGRLIDARAAYDLDLERIIRHARDRGCYLEANAQPVRLDLTDSGCRMAKAAGVLVSLNSDAHSVLDLGQMRFGVDQARRGWLEKDDVLNTRSLAVLRPLLARPRIAARV